MVGNQYSPMSWKNQASLPQVLPTKLEAFFSKQASNSKDFLSKYPITQLYCVFTLLVCNRGIVYASSREWTNLSIM
jgi:hypothetical protein